MSVKLYRSRARLTGTLYLLYFVIAVTGGLLMKGLVIHGNAGATAQNFATHEIAIRGSSALGLMSIVLYLVLIALFYELFRPVSRALARLATLLGITACGMQELGNVFLAPFHTLAFTHEVQSTDTSRLLLESLLAMHTQCLATALVLFGAFDLVIGILILKSTFLPRLLGALMALAGMGWMVYLWPPLAARLSQVVQPFGFLAEAALMVWLVSRGIDEHQWRTSAE